MAQIYVGNGLVKPKSINVYSNNEWNNKRVGYIYRPHQWVPFIQYEKILYSYGIEYEALEGRSFGRNSDHIFMTNDGWTGGNAGGFPAINYLYSSNKINVTDFKKLIVTYEHRTAGSYITTKLGLSKSKPNGWDNDIFEVYMNGRSDGKIYTISLDISKLQGEFHFNSYFKADDARPDDPMNGIITRSSVKVFEIRFE